jgi:hypothetical protein
MKKFAAPLMLALLSVFMAIPARAEFLRTYVSGGPTAAPAPVEPLAKDGATAPSAIVVPVGASWWFGPSIGFDVFQIDLKSRQYVTGIVPGIGYGLKYCPKGWTATTAVLALDLFVQASLVDNSTAIPGAKYFTIEALPIVTILDWVSIGFGADEYVGVSSLPSELHWVFSFGMKKST